MLIYIYSWGVSFTLPPFFQLILSQDYSTLKFLSPLKCGGGDGRGEKSKFKRLPQPSL